MATYERESIKSDKISLVPHDSMSLTPFASLCDLFSMLDYLELADSSLRREIQRCLEMFTVDFDKSLPMEIKKADRQVIILRILLLYHYIIINGKKAVKY